MINKSRGIIQRRMTAAEFAPLRPKRVTAEPCEHCYGRGRIDQASEIVCPVCQGEGVFFNEEE